MSTTKQNVAHDESTMSHCLHAAFKTKRTLSFK